MIKYELPLISVVCTVYNHEKYIKKAIDSILKQSYEKFELIIIDDGSTDCSREIIKSYNDQRIKIIFQENQGPSLAANRGIENAKGEWIVLMSGDDVAFPDRLEKQLMCAFVMNFKVLFSLPTLINDRDEILPDEKLPAFFNFIQDSSISIYRKLFYNYNFLCAPTAFIHKTVFQEVGMFCPTSLQLQDFEMWIRISKIFKIKIMSDRLMYYRIHAENLSGKLNNKRVKFEMKMVYDKYFNKVPWDVIHQSFSEYITYESYFNEEILNINKAFIYLSHYDKTISNMGLEILYNNMKLERNRILLKEKYNFAIKDFFSITNKI